MKTMRAFRRLLPFTSPIVTVWALLGACSDEDQTDVCLGPGCVEYRGAAGRNTLTSSAVAGFGGAADGGPSDAGAEG
ncbi:MAG TPA: hypothetical protein VMG12_13505, partial [Polyangiaceae bacterium]|nr:hypothetical protein [Polyangiaceae bacterium]